MDKEDIGKHMEENNYSIQAIIDTDDFVEIFLSVCKLCGTIVEYKDLHRNIHDMNPTYEDKIVRLKVRREDVRD